MNQVDLLRRCAELAEAATPYVLVTLVEITGSTPQDAGAKMIVTSDGLDTGTVGGGRVEAKAIDEALLMLREQSDCLLHDWSLKADVGMTCGGRVKLFFDCLGVSSWHMVIFGAGHVAQAVSRLLATLPCQVTCIDPRADWLARLPAGILAIESADPTTEVEALPADAFVLCMTQGHRSDLPVLQRIFELDRKFPYLGVIGSLAKAATLRKELAATGIAAEQAIFHCPVGLPIGSNHPAEIAVSIVAQLLEKRDAKKSNSR
ncbi:MAG: xanthine dehydrogenase accessory protein XdhC [Planctomycetes bacterium]|nr:xanthine dehydrogenase accessory protein XdhC [Planctomycetota bacterium]